MVGHGMYTNLLTNQKIVYYKIVYKNHYVKTQTKKK